MSIYTHDSMTNHHASGVLEQVSETVHTWLNRIRARRELALWTERELHDVGVSRSDVIYEAEKPFWRS